MPFMPAGGSLKTPSGGEHRLFGVLVVVFGVLASLGLWYLSGQVDDAGYARFLLTCAVLALFVSGVAAVCLWYFWRI